MNAPTRPVLRWHGGKWKLASWVLGFFPAHRVYVEPFGGAASILLRKERSYGEVYNDLDCDVVNLFRVLQDGEASAALLALLEATPFARDEFALSYQPCVNQVERARRLVMRSFMGMGSVSNLAIAGATGFRNNTKREGTLPAHDWAGYPAALRLIIDRLQGVVIENRDACEVMAQHDEPDVLHYVDPPYMPETRSRLGNRKGSGYIAYAHDMDRGGAHRPARAPSHAHRHGGALRLPIRSVRRHAARLAPRRNSGARRRRTSPHRSALAQSSLCQSPRKRADTARSLRSSRNSMREDAWTARTSR